MAKRKYKKKLYLIFAIVFVISMALTSAFALLEWETPMWIGVSVCITYIMLTAISIAVGQYKNFKNR